MNSQTKAYRKANGKTAEELHSKVPPDWYFRSIKTNLLQRWWHHSRFAEVGKLVEIDKEGKMLDIGCADGVFTNIIYKNSRAGKVIGIDVLKDSIDWAKKHWRKNEHLDFRVGDAHDLAFDSNYFGAVFALEVLEHIYDPLKVLKEIKRVLKKNGYALFLVPSDNILFNIVWFLVKNFWWAKIWEDTHIQTYKDNHLVKLSKKAGFKVEVDKKFWLGMLHLVKVRKV